MPVRGVSELYVDLMLTMVVLSISGLIISGFSSLSNSLGGVNDLSSGIQKPPLALLLKRGGRNYLLIANNDGSPMEFAVVVNGVKRANYLLNSSDVVVLELTNATPDDVYVIASNYVVMPKVIELR